MLYSVVMRKIDDQNHMDVWRRLGKNNVRSIGGKPQPPFLDGKVNESDMRKLQPRNSCSVGRDYHARGIFTHLSPLQCAVTQSATLDLCISPFACSGIKAGAEFTVFRLIDNVRSKKTQHKELFPTTLPIY